jgi:hypothetical protein
VWVLKKKNEAARSTPAAQKSSTQSREKEPQRSRLGVASRRVGCPQQNFDKLLSSFVHVIVVRARESEKGQRHCFLENDVELVIQCNDEYSKRKN